MPAEALKERELVLPITGMTCANCAATVERVLRKTEGVTEASVNFATERATVHLDASTTGLDELAAAVERVGFGVVQAEESRLDDAEAQARHSELRRQSRMFWTGVLFAGPLFGLSMAHVCARGAGAVLRGVGLLRGQLEVAAKSSREYGRARRIGLVRRVRLLRFRGARAQSGQRRRRRARLLRNRRVDHHAHQARKAARG